MNKLFIVSHTHWDREWYEPFQVFRARLVHCIDQVLDIFETDPAYAHFMLDGQTIVLEDYLEARPDREQILRNLVAAGKLDVGPWYVLPDMFLVSGEALIRNLQRGIRIARDFGRVMRVGYIPDPFGHISQTPQILRGFGFDTAVLRRGLADEPVELWWQASDGSRVLLCYLRDSYDNAAWLPRDSEGFAETIVHLRDSLTPHTRTANFLLMHGTDHMEPWHNTSDLIKSARAQNSNMEIVHAALPEYVERVKNEIAQRQLDLPVVRGELRNPKRHHLLPGVLSTRMWIKQRNARAQTQLEKWAEPFSAFADQPSHLLKLAWKYLLQNHPHDSICGCSVDQVHREMALRFDAVEQIAQPIIDTSLQTIAENIDTSTNAAGSALIVFNSSPQTRTDFVQATITTHNDFTLLDDNHETIPFHVSKSLGRVDIEFVARNVPGIGYKTFWLVPLSHTAKSIHKTGFIENEFFRIEPDAKGTVTIADKTTGAMYRNANHFVDGGDRGDLYNYCPPENDVLIDQPNAPAQIEIEHTAARQSIRLSMNYRLPAQLADERTARAPEFVDEKIVTTISIYPGVRRIDFSTAVDNRARDHRLQVEFPASIVIAYTNAGQAFDVVQRAIDLPSNTDEWIEQPRPEAPMQNFVSIDNGKIGWTLATRGLPEYSARRDSNGTTLALTLLRCIGWLSRDDLSTRAGHAGPAIETPGAQEIGTHIFEYALIPHAGDWRNAIGEACAFAAPMRVAIAKSHAGTLPPKMSFVAAAPREFVISVIKKPEEGDGLIVRGYNIANETIEANIVLWKNFSRAARVNLNEEEIAPVDLINEREVEIRVRTKEIVTIKFA
jgi:alpha-mannosidase